MLRNLEVVKLIFSR